MFRHNGVSHQYTQMIVNSTLLKNVSFHVPAIQQLEGALTGIVENWMVENWMVENSLKNNTDNIDVVLRCTLWNKAVVS